MVLAMDYTSKPLTTGQVADKFGVTKSTVTRWVEAGLLPYTKTLGGHLRFDIADIERIKDEQNPVAS